MDLSKIGLSRLFTFFQKVLPPITQTEREAIEAGDVWWEGELFKGNPQWQHLLAMPVSTLTTAEQSFLDNQVEHLCELINDWETVQVQKDLSQSVWQMIKEERFLGMIIPKEYGGLGFSALAHSSVVTKIASRSISAAVSVMVPNSLGPAELIIHYGTEQQKNYYLPRLAKGQEIPCFALTGPEAGSDAGSIPDVGIVTYGDYQGKNVLGMNLTWDKRYITLAPVATVLGLAFKLKDPNHLLGQQENLGVTLCLVPVNTPGVEIGERHSPLNMAFMNGPTKGDNIFLPLDCIIGGQAKIGQGWKMLVESLAAGRGISLPALSAASAALCYRMCGAYARVRTQFRMPIGHFEGVQEAMGRIAGLTYIMESTRLMTTCGLDQGFKPSVATAISKYHMTEMSRKIVNDAMDVHAGRGIAMGPANYLAHIYQSLPISITVEGANILTRSLMIFGQGAIRCHPYSHSEIEACTLGKTDREAGLKAFSQLFYKHVAYVLANFLRCVLRGLTRGYFVKSPVSEKSDKSKMYFKKLSWLSSGLALTSDITMMILGGKLKKQESLSARLGDVLSNLYLASAVLKYYHNQAKPVSDWAHVQWSLDYLLHQSYNSFIQFFNNFPVPIVGKMIQYIIFPFFSGFQYPSDKLTHQLALSMQHPSELRDRLTSTCFIGKGANDPTGLMEAVLYKVTAVAPILAKVKKSQALTPNEAAELQDYEVLRRAAIAVDVFPFSFEDDKKWKNELTNNKPMNNNITTAG